MADKARYEQVLQTEQDVDLQVPTHIRSCCPFIVSLHQEYSTLLWVDLPRVVYGLAILAMFFWEARTPVTTTFNWFFILLAFVVYTLAMLIAASSLAGLWFQRGKTVVMIWGNYLGYIFGQFLGGAFCMISAAHIQWKLCKSSLTDLDTTFASCGFSAPLPYRSYSEWDVTIAVMVCVQIFGLSQLVMIYLNAVRKTA